MPCSFAFGLTFGVGLILYPLLRVEPSLARLDVITVTLYSLYGVLCTIGVTIPVSVLIGLRFEEALHDHRLSNIPNL